MRVLLIDGDPSVRQTLAHTLAAECIEVDGLANAEDALVLPGAGQVPDVLVADIDLGPGLGGLGLAAIARARHPAAEVVLISGTAPDPGRPGYRERFLREPFPPPPTSPERSWLRIGGSVEPDIIGPARRPRPRPQGVQSRGLAASRPAHRPSGALPLALPRRTATETRPRSRSRPG